MSPTSTPPARSVEQRRQALQNANEIRLGRAELKRKLKEGRLSIHDVLDKPTALAGARVEDALMALPFWGKTKVGKTLTRADIHPRKTIAALTPRQREALHQALEDWGKR